MELNLTKRGKPILFKYTVRDLIILYDLHKISFTDCVEELEGRMNKN